MNSISWMVKHMDGLTPTPRATKNTNRLPDAVRERVVALLGQGMTCRVIAAEVSCSHAAVAKIGRDLKAAR